MMNCKKHLKISLMVIVVPVLFLGCSKKEKEPDSIVKVNNAVLTEEELTNAVGNSYYKNKFKAEYINNWIETEILFNEAVDEGILDDKDFQLVIEQSRKKLAISMYLKKILDNNKINPTADELLNYYNEKKEDWKVNDEEFRINKCEFGDFDKAVKFRTILLESDWNKAINAFRDDKDVTYSSSNQLVYGYMLQPQVVLNAVSNLMPNEVSIVLETKPSNYEVIQLVEKLKKGDIPAFDAVKEKLKEQYVLLKQKEFIRDYIDKLVEDHNVEIKRYKE